MRLSVLSVACALPLAAVAQVVPASLFDGLSWRMIGPFRGGRAEAATGVRGDPNTFYFGAVGGGVWKTTDAGTVWNPIFDAQHIASIGALEVAPSDPNILYAGTGETDLRSDISFGDGIYKSTDAGKTWRSIGLKDTRQIGRILVHPANPDVVLVAALGHAYGPNEERGVFRTTDGGQTWSKVLYKGPEIGAVDLAWPPDDPRTIYATLWNARRSTWSQYAPIEGPGSGLYKSSDGGEHWVQLEAHGLPEGQWRRAGIAATGRRVYALIDAAAGAGLYRSDDAGETWVHPGSDPRVVSRGWYFGRVTIDPKNPDIVYLPNVALYRTTDAGKSFSIVRGAPGGDDYHFLWIDPAEPSRMILATDQGVTISVDGARTWTTWYNQPTAQFYHVITDNQFPYTVYGTQQDSGTVAIASRTNHREITEKDWGSAGGSESGYMAPDPLDPNIVFVAGVYGGLNRFDKRTAQGQNITPWPGNLFPDNPAERKYRYPWTPPLIFSPVDPHTLYYGAQVLMKTIDGGLHWQEISSDLTGKSQRGAIYTIAPSPLQGEQIWVGSDTGLVHLTRDGGKSWSDVTPPELSEWSKITHIEASHFDAATAYAAVDRHRLDDYRPHLFRTRDYGKTWTEITQGMAEPAFLNAIREDPVKRGLLFAATELGVCVSFDDGDHWQPLQFSLPAVSVRDLVIHGDDLVIATHGRSFWIMDDITALRQADAGVAKSTAWLYQPAIAIRTSSDFFQGTPLPPEIPKAPNPPEGAIIDYYLAAPADQVTLEFLDPQGKVIRRYSSTDKPAPSRQHSRAIADIWIAPEQRLTARAGMNRFVWDLRYATSGRAGPQVVPETYEVRLTTGGQAHSQKLEVRLDPRSTASTAALQSQLDLALQASRLLDQTSEVLKKIAAAPHMLPGEPTMATDLDKIQAALGKINGNISSVLEVAESADREPPAQALKVFEEARQEVEVQLSLWNQLKSKLPN